MEKKIGIIGLGYVGLPLAVAMAKKFNVVGYDINKNRIEELNSGHDNTNELTSNEVLENLGDSISYTHDEKLLSNLNLYIITVPTPINKDKSPNLTPVISATTTVSKYINKEDIVVFESTFYPGLTEEICIPILEQGSGLKINDDFMVGYSPERINPGDKHHTITKIKKVVSGSSKEALRKITEVYEMIIDAGIYEAESIKIAEAAKVIENTQRDINIAFVNELTIIFDKMNIDTQSVLRAAGTKWNFLNFSPGLVGGHCIGVDPYYLSSKSEKIGYKPKTILAGRNINDSMPQFIVNKIIRNISKNKKKLNQYKALILGATFKENCPDVRNSKVKDIYLELLDLGIETHVFDPVAEAKTLKEFYQNNTIEDLKTESKYDIIVLAVSHDEFSELNIDRYLNKKGVVFDVKSFFPIEKGYLRL